MDPQRCGASSKGWTRDRSSLLVRIGTDAGGQVEYTSFGVQRVPHVRGSVVGLAASLHLLASLLPYPPTADPSPYYQEPLLEFGQNPSPLHDGLSREPIRLEDGLVRVPQGPGLGITVNPEVLERYRVAS